MLSNSSKKPFWQSKTLWALFSLLVVTTAMPVAEMIEKKQVKPTDIAKILVAYILAAPVAYYRSKATQPLSLKSGSGSDPSNDPALDGIVSEASPDITGEQKTNG